MDFTDNPAWFNLQTYANEFAIKATLALYPAQTLNLYTCMPYGYLGFSYYPSTFPESSFEHCVFVDYRSLPGRAALLKAMINPFLRGALPRAGSSSPMLYV